MTADQALSDATLVIKGWLESTQYEGGPEADATIVIRIERVLKGATSRPTISVTQFLCGLEYPAAMRPGRPLIAFVTAAGRLVNGTAVLPASRSAAAPLSPDARTNLRNELLSGSTDLDPLVARAAIGALAELDGRASAATLERVADDANLGVRIRALSWLVRFGDVDALRRLAGIVSGPPFSPFAIPTRISNDKDAALVIGQADVTGALNSFSERDFTVSTAPSVHTAAFVAIVAPLADSRNLYIRRAAVAALRGFKQRSSFPVLVNALDDPDSSIRYNAMFTLCLAMRAPDLPCPAVPLFQSDEQRYIRRVRSWWQTQPR